MAGTGLHDVVRSVENLKPLPRGSVAIAMGRIKETPNPHGGYYYTTDAEYEMVRSTVCEWLHETHRDEEYTCIYKFLRAAHLDEFLVKMFIKFNNEEVKVHFLLLFGDVILRKEYA
jgi:hypothetical protein